MSKTEKLENYLVKLGIPYKLKEYNPSVKSAAEASLQIDISVDQMIKSLLFRGSNGYCLFLLSSSKRINLIKVNKFSSGISKPALFDDIKAITGYSPGEVTPFFLVRPIPIYIDKQSLDKREVSIATGTRGVELLISPTDLVRATSAIPSDICD